MKREIVCPDCVVNWQHIAAKQYEGEHVKIKRGQSVDDFLCDQCSREIPKGVQCFAVSVWSDMLTKRGRGYYAWEGDYMIADVEEVPTKSAD